MTPWSAQFSHPPLLTDETFHSVCEAKHHTPEVNNTINNSQSTYFSNTISLEKQKNRGGGSNAHLISLEAKRPRRPVAAVADVISSKLRPVIICDMTTTIPSRFLSCSPSRACTNQIANQKASCHGNSQSASYLHRITINRTLIMPGTVRSARRTRLTLGC